jgi:hypothetical protein
MNMRQRRFSESKGETSGSTGGEESVFGRGCQPPTIDRRVHASLAWKSNSGMCAGCGIFRCEPKTRTGCGRGNSFCSMASGIRGRWGTPSAGVFDSPGGEPRGGGEHSEPGLECPAFSLQGSARTTGGRSLRTATTACPTEPEKVSSRIAKGSYNVGREPATCGIRVCAGENGGFGGAIRIHGGAQRDRSEEFCDRSGANRVYGAPIRDHSRACPTPRAPAPATRSQRQATVSIRLHPPARRRDPRPSPFTSLCAHE